MANRFTDVRRAASLVGRWPGALLLGSLAASPWMLGFATGHAAAGITASFGAYLTVVAFPTRPDTGRALLMTASVATFGSFALLGAAVRLGSGAFFAAALLAALAQAVAELKGRYLRLPVALAVLCFFLSVGQSGPLGPVAYAAMFTLGSWWAAIGVSLLVPVGPAKLLAAASRADRDKHRRYVASVGLVALTGAIGASAIGGLHPCWLPAAALRLMKPTREETLHRSKARGLGSLSGAVAVSLILYLHPDPRLYPFLVAALVTAMLVIGAKRYGAWSFCLTIVALLFNSAGRPSADGLVFDRVLLTLGAVILALVASMMLGAEAKRG